MQKIAIAGLGFMGQMHAQVYAQLPDAELTAIVDADLEGARRNARNAGISASGVPLYASLGEALSRHPDLTVVDVCLPTHLHRGCALEAIAAGKNVFCEKPLALTAQDADAIARAACERGVALQVGHVVRFFPESRAFVAFVKSNRAGRLLSLNLTRRVGRPGYSKDDWLQDPARSLGAIFDLHIHDTDFVHHLLGTPRAVTSFGTKDAGGWTHVFTRYHFDGIAVQAEGGWNYPAKWGFNAAFQAVFENGAVEYDSAASPTLRVTLGNEDPQPLAFEPSSAGKSRADNGNIASLAGYFDELEAFVATLERGEKPEIATGEQAARSVKTVLAEIESIETGRTIYL